MKKLLFLCLILAGCSPKVVTVTEYRDRYHTLFERDSVFVKDSTVNNSYTSGDTVFRDRVEYKYLFWSKMKNDTVYQRDSIPYPVDVVKEVNVLTDLQRMQIRGFWILLAVIGLYYKFKINK